MIHNCVVSPKVTKASIWVSAMCRCHRCFHKKCANVTGPLILKFTWNMECRIFEKSVESLSFCFCFLDQFKFFNLFMHLNIQLFLLYVVIFLKLRIFLVQNINRAQKYILSSPYWIHHRLSKFTCAISKSVSAVRSNPLKNVSSCCHTQARLPT